MHDGQMLFDSTETWNKQEWGVDETMTQLLTEKKIKKTIVVGIWNTEFRHSEYFPQKPFDNLEKPFRDSLVSNSESAIFKKEVCSDDYLKFIVQELKPHIDKRYATFPDNKNTFIAGSSMGGLISIYALCEYPEVFYGAGCLSTHWLGTFDTIQNPIPKIFAEYLDDNLPNPQNHRIYFDYGTETLDAYYEPHQLVVDSIMQVHNYKRKNWISLKFEGYDHTEKSWNTRLHTPLEFLLRTKDVH